MKTQNTNWKVEISSMLNIQENLRGDRVVKFNNFKQAYQYYNEIVNDRNLHNAEYSDAEMELSAGGIGYDWRVELLEDNGDDN